MGQGERLCIHQQSCQLLAQHTIADPPLLVHHVGQGGLECIVRRRTTFRELGHGCTLMLEQLFGQRPAFAFLAHKLSHRHPHIVEEDLTETGLAADQFYGLDRDAGTLHVDQQKADAVLLLAFAAGAHQRIHPVALVSVRGPDLAPVDDIGLALLVRHAPGRGLEAGQIRTGIGLRKALTPALLAAHHGNQMLKLLLMRPHLHQNRPQHPHAQVVLGLTAAKTGHLRVQDTGFPRGESTAAVFTRP